MCEYCNTPIYVTDKKLVADRLAAKTVEGEVWQKVLEMSGCFYAKLENRYCPFCGERVR